MSSYFELSTSEGAAADHQAKQLVWAAAGGNTPSVRASVNPWLTSLGQISAGAIDLVRVATAALIADRRSPRPAHWGREIKLRVHVVEPARWTEAVATLSALLQFLSGDIWEIELVADSTAAPDGAAQSEAPPPAAAALFSGGLDSFCGALITNSDADTYLYVSQRDNPTLAGSQNRAGDWLRGNVNEHFRPLEITLAQAQQTIEGTSRTRSLLYLALGIAAAEASGAPRLVVPENGFTSLNPPLRTDRTGPLSTRSTHPYSLALLDLLRGEVGIRVVVENPYTWLTKGELVATASKTNDAASAGIATTLSCAKLDGRLYKGGNQNWNCGLCVACIVRRAAIAAAGISNDTPYVATKVAKPELVKLVERRRSDIRAIQWALAAGADDEALISATEFPVDFDVDRALELWQRALKEITLVDLP